MVTIKGILPKAVMKVQTFEIEADTIVEAKRQANRKRPQAPHLFSEEIVSDDGKNKTIKGVADTIEKAFKEAQKKAPADAKIIEKTVISSPAQKVFTVEAFEEQGARAEAMRKVNDTMILKSLTLKIQGKKGFLTIGKKPNVYKVQALQRAVIKLIYKQKVKIRVKMITEIPTKGYCQGCGKRNSPIELSDKSAHFFCSSFCGDRYKVGKRFYTEGPGTNILSFIGVFT